MNFSINSVLLEVMYLRYDRVDTEQVVQEASVLSQSLMNECLSEGRGGNETMTKSKRTHDYPL